MSSAVALPLSLRERVAEPARPGEGVSSKWLTNVAMTFTDALTLTLSRRERGRNWHRDCPCNYANCPHFHRFIFHRQRRYHVCKYQNTHKGWLKSGVFDA